MKVLFIVVAAFVAVNAGPVPVNQLKQIAQHVLEVTESLQTRVNNVLEATKIVRDISAQSIAKIPSVVAENKEIVELKKSVEKSAECQKVFDSRVEAFHAALKEYLTKSIDNHLIVSDSMLAVAQMQLGKIEEDLTIYLDDEIKACHTEGAWCKITDFDDITDSISAFMGNSNINDVAVVAKALVHIQKTLVADRVQEAVVAPVKACLGA